VERGYRWVNGLALNKSHPEVKVNFLEYWAAILILAHVKDLRFPNCAISEPLTQQLRPPLASELSLLPIGVPSHSSTQRYCRFQNEPPPLTPRLSWSHHHTLSNSSSGDSNCRGAI
jgi:hypothetical protein